MPQRFSHIQISVIVIAQIGLITIVPPPSSHASAHQTFATRKPAGNPREEKTGAGANNSSDIIVHGIPPGPYAVTVDEPTIFSDRAEISRQAASNAQFFSRCVKPADNSALGDLIDGPPNGSIRVAALDRIVRNHIGCYPNFDPVALWTAGYYGDCNARGDVEIISNRRGQVAGGNIKRYICQSFFDRGALVERVLRQYAPDLQFTTAELLMPEVVARLHAREDRFDKSRPKSEQLYAKIVTCMVAFHPGLALAYPKSGVGSALEAKLRNALIGTSPQCVAGAKRLSVDPSQFRVYVADAIYSWAIALKGTVSLIPASR